MSVIYWVWSHMRQNEQPAWTLFYLQCIYLSDVIPTGDCTCIVHWYDMPTNIKLLAKISALCQPPGQPLLGLYNSQVRFDCTSQLLYLWCCVPRLEIPWTYPLRISPKWHRSKLKTPVSSETTLLTPWLISFSVHSKCLITIFWFFVRSAYIWSKYYSIMATFSWHIIITSDYKLDGIMDNWANPHLKNNENICHW